MREPRRPLAAGGLALALASVTVLGALGAVGALGAAVLVPSLGGALAAAAAAVIALVRGRAAPMKLLPAPVREPEAVVAAAALAGVDALADLPLLDAEARLAAARALAAAAAPGPLLEALLDDDDDEVRAAAVDGLAAQAAAGAAIPAELRARVVDRERATVAALIAVRPTPGRAPALHVDEVDRALRAVLARLRALALASPELRAAVEQAMATPVTRVSRALVEPWLTALLAGEHALREPALAALRACPRFAALPGRRADDVATRADRRWLSRGDVLFRRGDPPGPVFIVITGALALDDSGNPDATDATADDARTLGPGTTVGLRTPRAATVRATELTQLLAIDREAFAAAAAHDPRAPAPAASEN